MLKDPIEKNKNKLIDMDGVENLFQAHFPNHPFKDIPDTVDFKKLLANYLAMSQAFPYLQAGSQKELIFHSMENNEDIPLHVELTSVVGNFLCWDETGGLYPTIAMGLKALPRILETHRFHANVLKNDCITLFGEDLLPDYAPVTKKYLFDLYDSLASLCPLTRAACMVSFENHANRMIQALWESLENHFHIAKKSLNYFNMHVGGTDPAEAYHVDMTNKLIEKIVQPEQSELFTSLLLKIYAMHFNWCKAITEL